MGRGSGHFPAPGAGDGPLLAVLGAGALLATVLLGGCGSSTDSATAGGLPSPPDGSRWVGQGRVVVAVPDWWTTGETRCNEPQEDTVYYDFGGVLECSDEKYDDVRGEVSSLAVLDGSGGFGEHQIRSMHAVSTVAGREVMELEECNEWFPGVCRRLFAVPGEGVVFGVTIDDPDDGSYEEIRDSVHILPDGLTTVPLRVGDGGGYTPSWGAEPSVVDPLVKAIQAAGLRTDVEVVPPGDEGGPPEGSLLDVSPSLGSVVEEGATVTVSVMGG